MNYQVITSKGAFVTVFAPDRDEIERLQPGDQALDCFGRWREVAAISYRGVSPVDGAAYVGFYTPLGDSGRVSNSYREGEIVRTVSLTGQFPSAEIGLLQRQVNAARAAGRTLP